MKTEVRPVVPLNPHAPYAKWVVQWQSLTMSAPAFWYYETEELARDAARRLQQSHYLDGAPPRRDPPPSRPSGKAAASGERDEP